MIRRTKSSQTSATPKRKIRHAPTISDYPINQNHPCPSSSSSNPNFHRPIYLERICLDPVESCSRSATRRVQDDANPLISFYKASSRDPAARQVMEGRTRVPRLSEISRWPDILQDIDRRYRSTAFASPFFRSSPRLFVPSRSPRVVFQSSPKKLRKAHARSARVTRRGGRRGRLASVSFLRGLEHQQGLKTPP